MSKILYNVKKVVLTELSESTGLPLSPSKPIFVDTAEDVDLKPVVSKGDEKVLRSDNVILATASQPELLYGYDVTLKDNKFDLDIIKLIVG